MTRVRIVGAVLAVLVPVTASQVAFAGFGAQAKSASQPKPASATKKIPAAEVDGLLAPVALYPDQLLAQMLLCATTPASVDRARQVAEDQSAVQGDGAAGCREAGGIRAQLRRARAVPAGRGLHGDEPGLDDGGRPGVLDRPRGRARQRPAPAADSAKTGNLKSTAQQDVETKTTDERRAGDRHRAGEPAGRVRAAVQPAGRLHAAADVHHRRRARGRRRCRGGRGRGRSSASPPGSRSARRWTTTTTTGRTAGTAAPTCTTTRGTTGTTTARTRARTGTTTARTRARTTQDHREDMADARSERASDAQQQRGDRASTAQQQRTERQQSGQSSAASTAQTARSSGGTSTRPAPRGRRPRRPRNRRAPAPRAIKRGRQDRDRSSTAAERSGTGSDAFSGYSSGKSERSASARGQTQPLGRRWWRRRWRRRGGGGGGRTTAMIGGAHGRSSYLAATLAAWLIACLSVAAVRANTRGSPLRHAGRRGTGPDRNGQEGKLDRCSHCSVPRAASSSPRPMPRPAGGTARCSWPQRPSGWRLEDRGADRRSWSSATRTGRFPSRS